MNGSAPNSTLVVWDLPLRLFHWLLAVVIAIAFLSSEEDSALAVWHIAAGWVAAVLIVFRIAWGIVGGEHARFANFIRPAQVIGHLKGLASGRAERTVGHNPAGGFAALLLLGLVAVVVATGWVVVQGGEVDLHETTAWVLLGLVGVHVVAVVATSLLSRENLVRAMVTGRKRLADHPHAAQARTAGPAALLLALLVSGAATAGILGLDPQAFSPQAGEGAERAGEAADNGGEQGNASETAEQEGQQDRD